MVVLSHAALRRSPSELAAVLLTASTAQPGTIVGAKGPGVPFVEVGTLLAFAQSYWRHPHLLVHSQQACLLAACLDPRSSGYPLQVLGLQYGHEDPRRVFREALVFGSSIAAAAATYCKHASQHYWHKTWMKVPSYPRRNRR